MNSEPKYNVYYFRAKYLYLFVYIYFLFYFILQKKVSHMTWHEVQCRLREVQHEQQMCVHKSDLTELGRSDISYFFCLLYYLCWWIKYTQEGSGRRVLLRREDFTLGCEIRKGRRGFGGGGEVDEKERLHCVMDMS